MNQSDFGELIGSSGATVSNWINRVANPPIDKILKICKEFDVNLDLLVNGEIGRPNPQYDDFVKENHPELLPKKEDKPQQRKMHRIPDTEKRSSEITLGKNLDRLLRFNNLDKKEFDSLFGLSRGSTSKYTTGISYPKLETLVKMSDYLRVSLDELITGDATSEYAGAIAKQGQYALNEHPEPYNKDQIIRLMQEKINLLESDLAKTIGGSVKKEVRPVLDNQDVFGKTLLAINIAVETMKEKLDKLA